VDKRVETLAPWDFEQNVQRFGMESLLFGRFFLLLLGPGVAAVGDGWFAIFFAKNVQFRPMVEALLFSWALLFDIQTTNDSRVDGERGGKDGEERFCETNPISGFLAQKQGIGRKNKANFTNRGSG